MMLRKLMMGAVLAASAVAALPTAALARPWGHYSYYEAPPVYYAPPPPVYYAPPPPVVVERRVYVERPVYRERYVERPRYYRDEPRYRSCRSDGTTGLIVGAAAGALLGREIDGGRHRAAGTVIGGGTGALLGREIDRDC